MRISFRRLHDKMKRGCATYLATALLAGTIGWLAGLGMRGEEAEASSGKETALAPPPARGRGADAGDPHKHRTKSAERDDAEERSGEDDEGAIASVLYHPDGSVTFPAEWAERLSIHPCSAWDMKIRKEDLALLGVSAAESEALQAMIDGLLEERKALEAKGCKVIARKEGSVLLTLDAITVGEAVEVRAMRQMEAILQDRTALVMPLLDRHLGGLVSDAGPRVIRREQVDEHNVEYEEIDYDAAEAAKLDRELTVEDYRNIGGRRTISHTNGDHPRLGHLFPQGK